LRDLLGSASVTRANHGREGRLALALKYARLCKMIADQGAIVVIATISLFQEVHVWNRSHLPGYFEVYLDVPEEERRRRDPKGIYRRFDAGELCDVAGLDLPIDEPQCPDAVLTYAKGYTVAQQVQDLIDRLNLLALSPRFTPEYPEDG
jgi:adenylylsulfate kinase